MNRSLTTFAALAVAVAFVPIFFIDRIKAPALAEIAPLTGMSHDELLALGPRIAASTGATLGTSRRVVYLLACSGLATKGTIEGQATEASRLTRARRLSDREAVDVVLARGGGGTGNLKTC